MRKDLQAFECYCMLDCNEYMPVILTAVALLQLLTSIPSIMFVPFTTAIACIFPHLHKSLWQHGSFGGVICRFGPALLGRLSSLPAEEKARSIKGLFQGCSELFAFVEDDIAQVVVFLTLHL